MEWQLSYLYPHRRSLHDVHVRDDDNDVDNSDVDDDKIMIIMRKDESRLYISKSICRNNAINIQIILLLFLSEYDSYWITCPQIRFPDRKTSTDGI